MFATDCASILANKELGHQNRSDFGVGIRVRLVIEISVQWSVSNWLLAMLLIVSSVVAGCVNIKETVMKQLHNIVSFGAALLPVPGKIGASQSG